MRTLNIIIDEWGRVKTAGFAGHAGEHNATAVSVEFEADFGCDYYRMFFCADGGEPIKTNPMYVKSGKLYYTLPQSVTELGSRVAWQLVGYKNSGTQTVMTVKSDTVTLDFGGSLNDTTLTASGETGNTVESELKKFEDFLSSSDGFAKTESKAQADFETSALFGNHYAPTDKTGEHLKFVRVGNMVTVCGSVILNTSLDRGHTETLNERVVIYLPFKPAGLYYVTGLSGTSQRVMYLNPTYSSLVMASVEQNNGETVRLCFSDRCEEDK